MQSAAIACGTFADKIGTDIPIASWGNLPQENLMLYKEFFL